MKASSAVADFASQAALFYLSQALRVGYVSDIVNDRYIIVDEDEVRHQLDFKRIILFSETQNIASTQDLQAFKRELTKAKESYNSLEIQGLSLVQLCERESIHGDAEVFALYYHLKENPQYYYQKRQLFFSRNAQERADYFEKQEAATAHSKYLARIESWLAAFCKGESLALANGDKLLLIEDLRLLLQGHKLGELNKILQKQAEPGKQMDLISQIRHQLGDSFEDPALNASGLPLAFYFASEPSLPEAHTLPLAPQAAFSIDEKDSPDIDDAISFQAQGSGYSLGIHISNIALRLPPQHPLFAEAFRRVSSLYLPAGQVPMFPPRFSNELFSLQKERQMPVLSLYFGLDHAFQLQNVETHLEEIKIQANYNFFEVEKASHEERFQKLFSLMESLRHERESHSENEQYHYQLFIKQGHLQMRRIESKSPARLLVEELMILYNRSLADFALKHQIPVLYRNINKVDGSETRQRKSPACLSLEPRFHPGIGAAAYLHASSPIRRVVDLINQMQLNSFLLGKDLAFEATELEALIPDIEKRILVLRETMQRSERYWWLKYIEENLLGTPLNSLFKGYANNQIKAELLPWGKQFYMESEAQPETEQFHLVVYQVNWDKMTLLVDLIG